MNSSLKSPSKSGSKGLENEYRVALRQLRGFRQETPQDYSQGLSAVPWNYASEDEELMSVESAQASSNEAPMPSALEDPDEKSEKSVTEKIKVLDSLQDFARKQLAEGEKESIRFPGGEIRNKDLGLDFLGEYAPELKKQDEIKQQTSKLSPKFFDLKFSLSPKAPLKAMFIAECSEEVSELQDKELGLEAFFDRTAAQLFDRMIQAMKFKEGEVLVSSCNVLKDGEKLSFEQELVNEILSFRPQVVFSLGGATTARLLGSSQRLQNCHGQFFEKEVAGASESHKFEVMPLFSPAFLVEAPNSKRIAWEDMQKAMSKLGL